MNRIITKAILRIKTDPNAGEGTTNVLIAIIIAVVAAGIVIGLVSSTFPELWASLISKMQSLFD